jgi:hypothetical protein
MERDDQGVGVVGHLPEAKWLSRLGSECEEEKVGCLLEKYLKAHNAGLRTGHHG